MTPEQIAQRLIDKWYLDAAAFIGPSARKTVIASIADAIRAEREHCVSLTECALCYRIALCANDGEAFICVDRVECLQNQRRAI